MSPLVFAAIAPHGDLAIAEACEPDQAALARATQQAMGELAARFEAARPQATIVLTPHNVHVDGAFAVVVAASLKGALGDFLPEVARSVELSCPVDRELASSVLASLRAAGIPTAGVSFGGNVPDESVMPMDWGTLVPLWFLGARADPPVPAVAVSPARDRPLAEHVRAGEALADAVRASRKRVAVVASADHGHAHQATGRYGYDPAAEEFDRLVVEHVRGNRLEALLELGAVARAARADSLWQMVMLHGALGDGWRAQLLSYEAPTYYGMLCAAFAPAPERGRATS